MCGPVRVPLTSGGSRSSISNSIIIIIIMLFCYHLSRYCHAMAPPLDASRLQGNTNHNNLLPTRRTFWQAALTHSAAAGGGGWRRWWLCSLFIPITTTLPESSWTVAEADESYSYDGLARRHDEQPCQEGRLALEQAVPGAYEQACMSLETRRIPIHVPPTIRRHNKDTNIKASDTLVTTTTAAAGDAAADEVVYLNIHQGTVASGSTGLAVWNSAILLTRLLERLCQIHPKWLQPPPSQQEDDKRTVLELGCGTGLASLACAVLGASRVVATDGNPQVIQLAERNVQANQLQDQVQVRPLSWGLLEAIECVDVADVVIGADLTYSPGSWPSLAETMATVLKDNGVILYVSVGHAGFNVNAEVDGFLSVAKQRAGLVTVLPTDADWPFPLIRSSLSDLLENDCIFPEERSILTATGGIKVTVLKKQNGRITRKPLLV